MAKTKREWHPRFMEYMNMIVHHPNYCGLPIKIKEDGSYSWIATAESKIGKARITWCQQKAEDLGFPIQAGVYADVMLAIHPTAKKVCQTCGREMSLYYVYPNVNFLKSLNKAFHSDFNTCDHISEIWDKIATNEYNYIALASFLIQKGGLELNPYGVKKEELLSALELACRKGGKNCLGPGAMSNFPDRFDGFHTYNRCCRASQDKGRSKENMKTYTKDRRAYEYWSDGNIHAANQFMGSSFFKGVSADHIGPISLGFVHDPRYLQPMKGNDNSTKRDRLQLIDIEKIIQTEARTGIYPMSWYSSDIWEYIKDHFRQNPTKIGGLYRDALKQNMSNFMFVLFVILEKCQDKGERILTEAFLSSHYSSFENTYIFNEDGEIVHTVPRHYTGRNEHEIERYKRIAIQAVFDYQQKENRNIEPNIEESEMDTLLTICDLICTRGSAQDIKLRIVTLVKIIENRIIGTL